MPTDEQVEPVVLTHRVYLNGFPKSGLHLAERWIQQICRPAAAKPWLGTYTDNAWGVRQASHVDDMPAIFAGMPSSTYIKGHSGWSADLAEGLYMAGVATFLIYRDLRDVAVSAAYHVLDQRKEPDGRWKLTHPDKEMFAGMPFEDVLIDMIRGRGVHRGVVERWAEYAPWLDERWVCQVRFEDMRQKPEETAALFLRYVLGISGQFAGVHITIGHDFVDETVAKMLAAGAAGSSTFRKGKAGGWRKYWAHDVDRVWRAVGGPAVNKRLGYG